MLICLGEDGVALVLIEVHEGVNGSHIDRRVFQPISSQQGSLFHHVSLVLLSLGCGRPRSFSLSAGQLNYLITMMDKFTK